MSFLKKFFGKNKKVQPPVEQGEQVNPGEEDKLTQPTSRADWVEEVISVVNAKSELAFPDHKAVVSMIGIEPPPNLPPRFQKALLKQAGEEFISELEQQGKKFDQINFRATVQLENKSSREVLVRHSDIKGGQISDFFWPPHNDWGVTPIIFSHVAKVQVLNPVMFP